ncbi:hypothetical protein AB0D08_35560 [Kitasatospora sp. NPDC048540]|uniref:hypothetical protein n=1 Tax=unclassified Kitasatospora TaxID=2633591 RepID=UPI0006EBBF6F|nr:hypothetical protein [Kitasatospora sp. MBT63]
MKLSKRATGALLLAVGAGVVASQGAAAATPMTPEEVASLEDSLSTRTVPFTIPLSAPTSRLPVLAEGGEVSGAIPTSPLMPPPPKAGHQLMPEQVIPSLAAGKVGPALKTTLPLPAAADGVTPGTLGLDAPSAPLHAAGPALELGQPVSYLGDHSGELADGMLAFGELDPRLVTEGVQAVPGASASLGGDDKPVSAVDTLRALTEAAGTSVDGVLNQDVEA